MTRAAARLGTVLGVLAALLLGGWFWGAVVAPGYWSAIAAIIAWFLAVGTLTARLARRAPGLRWALRGTYLVAAVAAVATGLLTSVRETTVDEPLVTGVPASRLAPSPGAGDPLPPQGSEPRRPTVDDLLAPQR